MAICAKLYVILLYYFLDIPDNLLFIIVRPHKRLVDWLKNVERCSVVNFISLPTRDVVRHESKRISEHIGRRDVNHLSYHDFKIKIIEAYVCAMTWESKLSIAFSPRFDFNVMKKCKQLVKWGHTCVIVKRTYFTPKHTQMLVKRVFFDFVYIYRCVVVVERIKFTPNNKSRSCCISKKNSARDKWHCLLYSFRPVRHTQLMMSRSIKKGVCYLQIRITSVDCCHTRENEFRRGYKDRTISLWKFNIVNV